jgi:hypothetical protein
MKFLILALALIVSNVFAGENYNTSENPHEEFSVSKVNSNNIQITFMSVDNVQATCDKESRNRGYGGFGRSVEACSFWESSRVNNHCTIVVGKTANYHTIGHEMRHCLQGNFHK